VTKGQEGPISYLQGLILHKDDRQFSNKAEGILRHGQPLQMWVPGYVKE